MNEINININAFQGKRVLIAPLNWGLGHATRCIPIIEFLLSNNVEIAIASDGQALDILKHSFPDLPHFTLPSYNVGYPFKSMELNMILQSPKILNSIRKEQQSIKQIVNKWAPEVIISDNRYGCRSNEITSIFITHQVNIMASNPLSKWMVNLFNRIMINRFDQLWIPDDKGSQSLSGDLSMSKYFPNAIYLNPISRFRQIKTTKTIDVLILLSGPEPARTRLEDKMIDIFKGNNYKWFLVRGSEKSNPKTENIPHINMMYGDKLSQMIQSAQLVICRSGYTSIMDLNKLDQKAILIPTPGQPEQEYLVKHLQNHTLFDTWNEHDESESLKQLVKSSLR